MLSVRHFLISVAYAKLSFWNYYYEIQIWSYRISFPFVHLTVHSLIHRHSLRRLNGVFRLPVLLPTPPLSPLLQLNRKRARICVCVCARNEWGKMMIYIGKCICTPQCGKHSTNESIQMLKAIMSHAFACRVYCNHSVCSRDMCVRDSVYGSIRCSVILRIY